MWDYVTTNTETWKNCVIFYKNIKYQNLSKERWKKPTWIDP